MQVDQETLRRKNEELIQALREKSRKQLQTQELYDKLKRRAMLGEVQNAALDAVDHNIQASVIANRFVDREDNQNQPHRAPPPPLFSNQQMSGIPHPRNDAGNGLNGAHNGRSGHAENTWAGFSSQGSGLRESITNASLSSADFIARKPADPNAFHPPPTTCFWKCSTSTDWTGQSSRNWCTWTFWSPHDTTQSLSSATADQYQRKQSWSGLRRLRNECWSEGQQSCWIWRQRILQACDSVPRYSRAPVDDWCLLTSPKLRSDQALPLLELVPLASVPHPHLTCSQMEVTTIDLQADSGRFCYKVCSTILTWVAKNPLRIW